MVVDLDNYSHVPKPLDSFLCLLCSCLPLRDMLFASISVEDVVRLEPVVRNLLCQHFFFLGIVNYVFECWFASPG